MRSAKEWANAEPADSWAAPTLEGRFEQAMREAMRLMQKKCMREMMKSQTYDRGQHEARDRMISRIRHIDLDTLLMEIEDA